MLRNALAAALVSTILGLAEVPVQDRSAPIDLRGDRLAVVNPDSASVTVLDAASRTKIAEIRVGSVPQTVTLDPTRAYVACDDGRLVTIDLAAARVLSSAKVGVELYGVVSDGERVFVSDPGDSSVRVLDGTRVTRVATEEYPRGLALSGTRLYVTHFRTGRISVIDTDSLAVTNVISTGPDSNLSQSITVAGSRAYVPQTRTNTTNQSLLFDTTVFPVVSVVNIETHENQRQLRFALDVVDRPLNMPLDSAITDSGKLYVVHAGSDAVSAIDVATRKTGAHITVGSNPRGIALSADSHFAYVSNALSGTVSVIDTATDKVVDTIRVTTIPLPSDILNGKILFHTAARTSLAKDAWISCATCHFDGSVDGRTWFFKDGPRNTTPIFGVSATLPMHWSGDLDELQDVESTVRTIQAGTGLAAGEAHCEPACDRGAPNAGRSKDLDDLAAFMAALRPPQRDATLSDAAVRGRALFASADCTSCHPPPLYTDRTRHDVGTGNDPKERKGSAFDTPSLRGLYDTAPYLHDGSAATLHDVLARHGDARALTASERADLVEFLRSIPFLDSRRRAAR
jgi:YVTN family beta-propeller protein